MNKLVAWLQLEIHRVKDKTIKMKTPKNQLHGIGKLTALPYKVITFTELGLAE